MEALEYKKLYASPEFREKREAPRAELGALYSPETTIFRVWSPDAEAVCVKLYLCGTPEEAETQSFAAGGRPEAAANPRGGSAGGLSGKVWNAQNFSAGGETAEGGSPQKCPCGEGGKEGGFLQCLAMNKAREDGCGGVWECSAQGDLHGIYYTYALLREGIWRECTDPYTRACGADGRRGMVADLRRTDPKDWEEDGHFTSRSSNTVIYELHVKDFSYHQSSGIARKHRGKYLAFTDNPGRGLGVDYLKRLGISHVHLLPVFDFDSVQETGDGDQFNWGYDPLNYNVPEGSYATDARHGEVRIREFKEMVAALHRAGIGVIMDVVYNHTYDSHSSFQTLAPFYYYRQRADGSLSDGSGCGNETASERTMCGKFIRESVLYWAEEYHIDGFRFDLMGLHDTKTLNDIRRSLDKRLPDKNILIYGEPWTAAASPMEKGFIPAVKGNVDKLDEGIAIFCDDTRDAVKGSVFDGRAPGFVNGGKGFEEAVVSSFCAWCDGGHSFSPRSPRQIISYMSVHDNYTLWDKLVLTRYASADRGAEKLPRGRRNGEIGMGFAEKRKDVLAMNKLAAGIIFTSLGTPLFQAGEEFGRTKYGDENSYRSSASINCLDWDRKEAFRDLTEYYRGLIALRGQIPLYENQEAGCQEAIDVIRAGDGVVELCLDLAGYSCPWKKIYIAVNAAKAKAVLELPPGEYQKLADGTSSWLWKKDGRWHKTGRDARKVRIGPVSVGIWGGRPAKA